MMCKYISVVSSLLTAFLVASAGNVKAQDEKAPGSIGPGVIKGYKFFDSETGEYIQVKGIDYFPRPNQGHFDFNSADMFTEATRSIWERDIAYFKELGLNAVRLYAVDPDLDHSAFMCALLEANLYAIVEVAHDCPTCAITRDKNPDCYPPELKTQGQKVINEFSKYKNTLGFSTGNEVNHVVPVWSGPEWNAPCQKKFLRDMRAYVDSCHHKSGMRKVPIGLIVADSDRRSNAMYYNCLSDPDDEFENAEWYGVNSYVFCDGKVKRVEDALGFIAMQNEWKAYKYSIPVLNTEFGCLSATFETIDGYEAQRNFLQAKWMVLPFVQENFAGGFAFEYSIEYLNAHQESPYPFTKFGHQNYGIGYFSPEDCNDVDIPCVYNPMPAFYNLKEAYAYDPSDFKLYIDDFVVPEDRQGRSECPEQFPLLSSFAWEPDNVTDLSCPKRREAHYSCPGLDDNSAFPVVGIVAIAVLIVLVIVVAVVVVARRNNKNTICLSSDKVDEEITFENGSKEEKEPLSNTGGDYKAMT